MNNVPPIIPDLSNEDYHHSPPYSDYLSSSQLKWYAHSPSFARYMMDHPQPETDAMRFGSIFHDLMASLAGADGMWPQGYGAWLDGLARFDPPENAKTGQPFGPTTKAYAEAYQKFLTANEGKTIVNATDSDLASDMAHSLLNDCGATSRQVRQILKHGKPEISFFVDYEGCKFKFRPDLLTRYKMQGKTHVDLYDWKTVSTGELTEENINRIILRYGYHISCSHYQFFYHELTGIWPRFILVLVSKTPPYDSIMVDMANYGYRYWPEADMIVPGSGALEFKRLLDLHISCTKSGQWPGAETFIPGDRHRILEIQPPRYYQSKFIETDI